jgi:hypothetical protein
VNKEPEKLLTPENFFCFGKCQIFKNVLRDICVIPKEQMRCNNKVQSNKQTTKWVKKLGCANKMKQRRQRFFLKKTPKPKGRSGSTNGPCNATVSTSTATQPQP